MKYGFTVSQFNIEGEKIWIAKSKDLEFCVGQGETCEEAIRELEGNEKVWLEMAQEDGEDIPAPSVEEEFLYSGKFTVRFSKSLHERVAERAKKDGVSLNSFIVEAVSEKLGTTSKQAESKFMESFQQILQLLNAMGVVLSGTKNIIYDVSEITGKLAWNLSRNSNFGFGSSNYMYKINGDEICN